MPAHAPLDDRAQFAQRVLRERTARGWSQGELADRAGVDRSVVSRLESGDQTPLLDTAIRLAGALGLGVALVPT